MPSGEALRATAPLCSVIVPVYDHWTLVPGLLDSLAVQTLPQADFEVILVDNGSTHFFPPSTLPNNVHIVHGESPGSYAARNEGVRHAKGKWLVFTDADCRACPNWLASILEKTKEAGKPELIAGGIQMYTASSQPNAYEIYDMIRGIPQAAYVRRGYAATANLMVPKTILAKLGGFDAHRYSGGDADLCKRARARGYALRYAPDAMVYHPARRTWDELATKARRIKGGQLRCGAPWTRFYWAIRTLLPPFPLYYRFATSTGYPVRFRAVAVAIQTRLWGHEFLEMGRLVLAAGARERR